MKTCLTKSSSISRTSQITIDQFEPAVMSQTSVDQVEPTIVAHPSTDQVTHQAEVTVMSQASVDQIKPTVVAQPSTDKVTNQTVMAEITSNVLDFELEKQKLLKKEQKLRGLLALFDEVEKKKGVIELVESSILDLQEKIGKSRKAFDSALVGVKSSEADLAELRQKYEVRKAGWLKKMEDGKDSIFSFSTVLSWFEADKLDQLKIAAQLAEENASLVKECLEVEELAAAVAQRKLIEVTSLEAKLKLLERDMMELGKRHKALEAEMVTTEKEWVSKWNAELRMEKLSRMLECDPDDNTRKSDMQELVDQIKNEAYEQGKQEQEKRSAEAMKQEKTSWEKIAAINEHKAYQRGRSECYKAFSSLIMAGRGIRERKLEWVKGDPQNEKILDLGNQASHYGMAVADASLYQGYCFSKTKRVNTAPFVELYDLEPDFVWARREALRFMKVLDWRAAMRDFHGYRYSAKYESTKFDTILKPILVTLKTDIALQKASAINQYFLTHEAEYQQLKVEHAIALAKHKLHLKANKYVFQYLSSNHD